MSVPEFLSGLTAFDAEIEERRKKAAADNAVLRYVASIKEGGFSGDMLGSARVFCFSSTLSEAGCISAFTFSFSCFRLFNVPPSPP